MKTRFSYKTVAAAILSGSLLVSPVVNAGGIPTFDSLQVAQSVKQGFQMAQQIKNQVEQIKQLKAQAEALRGSRSVLLGSVDTTSLKNDIPKELRELYKQSGITVDKQNDGKSYSKTKASGDNLLVAQMNNLSKFLDNNQKRLNQIERLMQMAQNAQDIKAATDLQNLISSYTTQLQTQQIEIENTERLYKMQKEVERKQRVALESCQIRAISSGNYAACDK